MISKEWRGSLETRRRNEWRRFPRDFRVLLQDSREISREGLGEKENIPRRALNPPRIYSYSDVLRRRFLPSG